MVISIKQPLEIWEICYCCYKYKEKCKYVIRNNKIENKCVVILIFFNNGIVWERYKGGKVRDLSGCEN